MLVYACFRAIITSKSLIEFNFVLSFVDIVVHAKLHIGYPETVSKKCSPLGATKKYPPKTSFLVFSGMAWNYKRNFTEIQSSCVHITNSLISI